MLECSEVENLFLSFNLLRHIEITFWYICALIMPLEPQGSIFLTRMNTSNKAKLKWLYEKMIKLLFLNLNKKGALFNARYLINFGIVISKNHCHRSTISCKILM